MRRSDLPLRSLCAAIGAAVMAGTATAQTASRIDSPDSIDRSFDPAPQSCADVRWSRRVLDEFPDINEACKNIQKRNGKSYAMLEGTVEDVTDRGRVTVDFEDGGEMTLAGDSNMTLYLDGEKTSFKNLREGQEVNFYIPEDRFQAEFSGANGSAPHVIVPILVLRPLSPDMRSADASRSTSAATGTSAGSPRSGSTEDRSGYQSTAYQGTTGSQSNLDSRSNLGAQSDMDAESNRGFESTGSQSNVDSRSNMDSPSDADSQSMGGVGAQSSADSQPAAGGDHPVVVLVPVVQAADTRLADGCWARLYDAADFKGNMLTLTGPIQVPRTRPTSVTGYEFGTNYDSVAVGPNATLKVWNGSEYSDLAATFRPGESVRDLSSRMAELEEIESMQVSCNN